VIGCTTASRDCGTPLTYRYDASTATVDVTTVSPDHPERFAPTREVWLEHKLAWQPLNAALVHYSRSSAEGQHLSS